MLQIESLSHVYPGGARALDGVSLSVSKGVFGLLGPNGAGKSTLMRCIATLQIPSAGTIRFDGADVLAEPAALRRQIGYLPQDFGVYPRISAYRMLDHMAILKGLADRGARREAVEAMLHRTNLWAERNGALAEFSGGMRQRFGIAQALIGRPRLLIIDEPTAGLDPEERNRFLDLLCEVGETMVVILSTHIVDDVANLCTRMAIISDGRIVLSGAPVEFTGRLQGRLWSKVVPKAEVARYRRFFNVILTRLTAGQILLHVLSDGDPGDGFTPLDAALEDVYFAALGGRSRAA